MSRVVRRKAVGGTPTARSRGSKEPRKMGKNYSDEFKKAMVEKMSGPDGKSANALAEEVGLHQSTLSRWRTEYGKLRSTGGGMSEKKQPQNWTAEQKMHAVLTYEGMEEQERGQYLREHGLYSVDIQRWREEMMAALNKKPKRGDPKDRRIRQLEGELRRKEKALAETAALLVLKKKAQEIWGDSEDEK
jgi:transposase-like protein